MSKWNPLYWFTGLPDKDGRLPIYTNIVEEPNEEQVKDIVRKHREDTLEYAKSGLHNDSATVEAILRLLEESLNKDKE